MRSRSVFERNSGLASDLATQFFFEIFGCLFFIAFSLTYTYIIGSEEVKVKPQIAQNREDWLNLMAKEISV